MALLSAAVMLLGLAAINPDAWIARHNLDRYEETGKVDWAYFGDLSDDAVPTIVDAPADVRACALRASRATRRRLARVEPRHVPCRASHEGFVDRQDRDLRVDAGLTGTRLGGRSRQDDGSGVSQSIFGLAPK